MDTVHHRLAELADDAPTGGAPPAELWARGKRGHRGHRLRVAGLAASLALIAVVAVGIGERFAVGDGNRSDATPAGPVALSLPIEYPVGEELPDLGDTPGPLAAIWVAPRVGGGAPEVVGLVAESGTFGTLPIDLPDDDPQAPENLVALSPDGRRIAYPSATGELIVGDLVSGENYSSGSEFKTRAGYTWIEANTLVGHVAGGTDADAWVWDPGNAPKLIDPTTYELPSDGLWFGRPNAVGPGTRDWWVAVQGGGPRSCSPPTLENWGGQFEVPELCDVLGFLPMNILLGHENFDHHPDDWTYPNDDNGTVVAWGSWLSDSHRRVVVTAGAPERVAFALDLIAEALEAEGGAS